MDSIRWSEVKDRLAEAIGLSDSERTGFLSGLAPGLRAEVETLLAAADVADLLDAPLDTELLLPGIDRAPRPGPTLEPLPAGPDPLVGARIGPYRVEALVGRGGMGDVYRARRADGLFDREVALKVVRAETDAAALLARFDAERRILGSLEHEGIARMIGAGAEDNGPGAGRSWLALEYVRGKPITEVASRLDAEARIRLVADVAEAVEHAHRRLVVHRDLKPTNVLVTATEEGAWRVKLLDFGIAKILDPEADHDLTGLDGRRSMTRAYAAPEQVRGETVTTATDVYGLGLLLYEVLAAARPFPTDQGARALEAAILAGDPPPPSAASRPEAGGLDPKRLRGDLDLICRTALAVDPADRYPSALAVADELRRVLAHEPITARRPSPWYRTRRFVARHRLGVATAAGILLLAAAGGVLFATRMTAERERTREALAEAEVVADTQDRLLRVLDPTFRAEQDAAGTGAAPTVAEVVDRTVAEVEDAYADQPAALGRSLVTLGETLFMRGERARADSLFARALALRRPLGRGGDPVVYAALIGRGHFASDGGDRAAARRFFREALAMEREHPDITEYSRGNSVEMFLAGVLDDADSRERELVQVLAERRAAQPRNPIEIAQAHNALGVHYFGTGQYREALREIRAAERIVRDVLGELHPGTISLRQNAAFALLNLGDYDEAEQSARATLDAARRAGLGPVQESRILAAIGHAQYYDDRLAEAERTMREGLRVAEPTGPTSSEVRSRLSDLAAIVAEQGRPAEALEYVRRVRRAQQAESGTDALRALQSQAFEALLQYATGERAEAVAAARPLARRVPSAEENRAVRAEVLASVGRVLHAAGDAEAAEPMLREALVLERAARQDDHWSVLRARLHYGRALAAIGRLDEARPHLLAARGRVPRVAVPVPLPDVDAEIDRLLGR